MSLATDRYARDSAPATGRMAPTPAVQRIPGVFQLLLGLYIVLTSSLPTVAQATAFGVQGGAGYEFIIAMITALARDLLLLGPVLVLADHRLGVLHPLLLGVVVWPLVTGMPKVIHEIGGWGGFLTGIPVEAPSFVGLPGRTPSAVWSAIARYNGLEILALAATFLGFWLFRRGAGQRRYVPLSSSGTLRFILAGLVGFSLLVLIIFVTYRGGLASHLGSFGSGRYRALAGTGPIIALTDLGTISLYVWVAARPNDVRSPLFLICLAAAIATQFISNGSRGSALDVPLFVGLVWAVRALRLPWRMALVLIPFLFAAVGLLGAVRSASWAGQSASEVFAQTGFAESLERSQRDIALRRSLSAQVPVVERGFDVAGGPLLGASYVGAVAAFVPRSMWEDKPRGPGSLYARLFLGMPKEGASIPVSETAEEYWNFGIIGVIALSFLYGAILQAVYLLLWRRYPSPFAIVFYALVVTTFQFSTPQIVRFEQALLLLGFCYLTVRIFLPAAAPKAAAMADRRRPSGPRILRPPSKGRSSA